MKLLLRHFCPTPQKNRKRKFISLASIIQKFSVFRSVLHKCCFFVFCLLPFTLCLLSFPFVFCLLPFPLCPLSFVCPFVFCPLPLPFVLLSFLFVFYFYPLSCVFLLSSLSFAFTFYPFVFSLSP